MANLKHGSPIYSIIVGNSRKKDDVIIQVDWSSREATGTTEEWEKEIANIQKQIGRAKAIQATLDGIDTA